MEEQKSNDAHFEEAEKLKQAVKCELCESADALYRCPGCLVRTCSLPCVQQHKEDSGCTGKRDKAAYISVKEFTETHLLSDYRFLEDAGRKADLAHKDAYKFNPRKPPFRVFTFLKQARQRGVDLRLMPYPMTRRKMNTSMFHYGTRCVRWRVEWNFPQENLKFTDKELPDSIQLSDTVNKHILSYTKSHPQAAVTPTDGSAPRYSLASYTEEGGCKYSVFMRVEGLQANKERYYELDKTKSMCDNLRGKRLIEFPILHLVPPQEASSYTQLSQEEAQELRRTGPRNQRCPPPEKRHYSEGDLLNPNSDIFVPQK